MDQNEAATALAVNFADVEAAAKRIAGKAVKTPLLNFPLLEKALGFRLLVKAETLQLTGSFKFRGACNKLMLVREQQPGAKAVVAFSSGNHAQGVAAGGFHARLQGHHRDAGRRAGASRSRTPRPWVRTSCSTSGIRNRASRFRRYRGEDRGGDGAAYDDPAIMAGQGTAGLELCDQAEALGFKADVVIAPASGGGLVAGVATAVKHRWPGAAVYAAEPATCNDTQRSLAEGKRVANAPGSISICDALMSPMPGELTFPVHRALLTGGLSASDADILKAMKVRTDQAEAGDRARRRLVAGLRPALPRQIPRQDGRGRRFGRQCRPGQAEAGAGERRVRFRLSEA